MSRTCKPTPLTNGLSGYGFLTDTVVPRLGRLTLPLLLTALPMITLVAIPLLVEAQTVPNLAQTPRSNQPLQAGNRVSLNGRSLTGTWMQWQVGNSTRIGVSDAALLQLFGLELLNTNDASRQPVQWFSDPTNRLFTLPTRRTVSHRFLDVTEIFGQNGWQLTPQGNTLQVTTPPAKILAIRQGRQPWGDRLVLELDRPIPLQSDQQAQELILNLEAQIDPELLKSLTFKPGNQVQSFKVEPALNQTRLRLGIPSNTRPRIWSLPNPNRVIIDIRPDGQVDRDILWAPGLRWRSQTLSLGNDRFPVVWLTVNPRQPGLSLRPILPNSNQLAGISPLIQTAQQAQVTAAINGGFFNRNNQFPLGALRLDGRWLSGPILNRGAIAWNATGFFQFDRLTLQETITPATATPLRLTHLNSAYIQAGIARYTRDWGSTYRSLSDNEIAVTIQSDRVVAQQSLGSAGSSEVTIPTNGYLLIFRANRTAAATFLPGTPVTLNSKIFPPDFDRYPQVIAAGPLLIQNRQIVLDARAEGFSAAFAAERASRSAIGQTSDGTLLIVAIHNRLEGRGPSLEETARLLQQMGAVNALNLDGGSSTTLYLGGQILDRLPRSAARVHNGLGISIQPTP